MCAFSPTTSLKAKNVISKDYKKTGYIGLRYLLNLRNNIRLKRFETQKFFD